MYVKVEGVNRGLTTVPLTQISCSTVFSKFHYARKVGTLCILKKSHIFDQHQPTGILLQFIALSLIIVIV